MTDEKFKEIIDTQTNLQDLPNTKLVEYLDLLSYDFDFTKDSFKRKIHKSRKSCP